MLLSAKEITNYVLLAEDGEIGRCKDFFFDDEFWTVRYMLADTAKWLPGRRVLISPISLGKAEWVDRRVSVHLTKDQIKESPPLEEHQPVSRQYEKKYFGYYQYPHYWGGTNIWGVSPYPPAMPPQSLEPPPGQDNTEADQDPEKSHLRSINEVAGYDIRARDGRIGHVEDFIVDDQSWTIRYMVVDTRNWLPGRKVLVPPKWIQAIDWSENFVEVDLTINQIKEGPEYDPAIPVNREYEERLYDFYGRPSYWK